MDFDWPWYWSIDGWQTVATLAAVAVATVIGWGQWRVSAQLTRVERDRRLDETSDKLVVFGELRETSPAGGAEFDHVLNVTIFNSGQRTALVWFGWRIVTKWREVREMPLTRKPLEPGGVIEYKNLVLSHMMKSAKVEEGDKLYFVATTSVRSWLVALDRDYSLTRTEMLDHISILPQSPWWLVTEQEWKKMQRSAFPPGHWRFLWRHRHRFPLPIWRWIGKKYLGN